MPYHFTQPCPTCGRHMRIALDLLGREVACQHCHAQFISSADEDRAALPSAEKPLMERVEEILSRSAVHRAQPTPGFSEPV